MENKMSAASILPSLPDPHRFLGRAAKPCRKCGQVGHYVNRLGGISCETCIPPRAGVVLLRLTITAGTWDDAENPFGTPDDPKNSSFSRNASGTHGSLSAASGIENGSSGQTEPSNTVKRNKEGHYADEELKWIVEPGGIVDQMEASAGVTPVQASHTAATCQTGETTAEKADRLNRMRTGQHVGRNLVRSDHGSVPAVLVQEMRFVAGSTVDERGVNRLQHTVYPEGDFCLLFVGRKIPPRDPEAAAIEASLKAMKDEAKKMAVIRLDGTLRMVDSRKVKAV